MVTKKLIPKPKAKVPHMVYVDGKSMPRVIHESYDEAHAEAIRLALKEPGHQVLVLQVMRQIRGEVVANSLPYEIAPF
jgi:hypothetical protein